MKTARQILPAQNWNKAAAYTSAALDFDLRHRRRIKITLEDSSELLLDLPHATRLRDGDGLLCSDGSIVLVIAKPEPLLSIHADTNTLIRISWHLGNRHLPTQLLPGELRIREDHVLADMIHGLGGHVHHISAPFDPEAGAYSEIPHSHHHDDHDHHHH